MCAAHYYHQKHMKRQYGLDWEEFDRLVATQNNQCALCGEEDPRWHVDHDHETGRVRALLCHRCNIGLGMFGDDPSRLIEAAQYIEARRVV